MTVVTRFAPSPTGLLHVGNVRTALVAWLFARNHNGKFILRIDDTDTERSKQEYVDAIFEDLEWLGLTWDKLEFQSKRKKIYEVIKQKLISLGRLYPCYETQEELGVKKKARLSRNLPPIYDRAALNLTIEQKAEYEQKGIKPHWRFLIADEDIEWEDGVRGKLHFKAHNLSDPVLIRADGSMTYTIASVWDDIEFGITDIIRGEDHVTNSAVHIQIFKALGYTPPRFSHLSLLKPQDNQKISKRLGGFDIRSLRGNGIEAIAIESLLAKVGTSQPVEISRSLNELIAEFSISAFSKSPVIYDINELERLNTKLIHILSFNEVRDRLSDLNIDEQFWDTVKPNLNSLDEIKLWVKICKDKIRCNLSDTDKEFISLAKRVLPEGDINENTWDDWISNIKENTCRKGKELFMPIRVALTGIEHGPELKYLLPLLGREKIIERMSGI